MFTIVRLVVLRGSSSVPGMLDARKELLDFFDLRGRRKCWQGLEILYCQNLAMADQVGVQALVAL